MTTREDLERDFEATKLEDQRAIVELLWPYWNARTVRLKVAKAEDGFKTRIRQWLELNDVDNEGIIDHEHNLMAVLGKPDTVTRSDIRPLVNQPSLLIKLASEGLLTLNIKAFKERRQSAPATWLDDVAHVAGVLVDGEGTSDLLIRRIDA